MQFYVVTESVIEVDPNWSLPAIVLQPVSWNDWWRWRTLYVASFVDTEKRVSDIGAVKIANLGSDYEETPTGTLTELDSTFQVLPKGFVSLGQDESYYQNLWNRLGRSSMRETLRALQDLAENPSLFSAVAATTPVSRSLLRSVPTHAVENTYANIIRFGDPKRSIDLRYLRPSANPVEDRSLELTFTVEPESAPPSNVHVLIGRNGSGKTTLLQSMTRALLQRGLADASDGELTTSREAPHAGIANVAYVAFSAFDDLAIPVHNSHSQWALPYSFIGLQAIDDAARQEIDRRLEDASENQQVAMTSPAPRLPRHNRKPAQLAEDFAESAAEVVTKSADRWRRALVNLESDPNFRDAAVSTLANESVFTNSDSRQAFKERATGLFKRLSSGHKIVLLTTTRLVETVTAETLVVLDEPEAHLHPPLLSAFTRALSDLMQQQNGVAIIATHSPVILQEVPARCVWKIDRVGLSQTAERPELESFGENVGTLTNSTFGLEVRESGFHKMLIELADRNGSYDAVIAKLNGELGFEGRAILHAWFARRDSRNG